MVTLSCLIVVASLFSQATSSMSASASPKIVDMYFLYFIIRLFLICLHHSTMYYRTRRIQDTGNDVQNWYDCSVFEKLFSFSRSTYTTKIVPTNIIEESTKFENMKKQEKHSNKRSNNNNEEGINATDNKSKETFNSNFIYCMHAMTIISCGLALAYIMLKRQVVTNIYWEL